MDSKQQLSGAVSNIAEDIKQGVPPSNKDVETVIDKTKAVIEKEGYKGATPEVIENLEKVLEDTRVFLNDKNSDEKIQKFIVHTKEMAKQMTSTNVNLPENERERLMKIQERTKSAAINIQNAAVQLISSPDFRSLLWDLFDLLREAGQQELDAHDTGVVDTAKQAQDSSSSKSMMQVAQETKDKAQTLAKGVASDMKEGDLKVAKETKLAMKDRWNEVLRRIGNNSSMKKAMTAFFDLFDELRSGYYDLKAEASKTTEELSYDANVKKLREEGWSIIAEFTGQEALSRFHDRFWSLYYQIKNDAELNQFFNDMRDYTLDAINNPSQLDTEEVKRRGDEMLERGRRLWYKFQGRQDADQLLRDAQALVDNIKSDPVANKLKDDAEALAKSTILDKSGRPSIQMTRETLANLKGIIVPLILDNLQNIPIGRVEGITDNYQFVFDNLSFSGKDILPEHVYLKFDADVDLDLQNLSTHDTPQYLLRMEFRGMDAILNDCHFWFKKTSFPSMEDRGVADLKVKGITIVMKWWSPREGPHANQFALRNIKCHVYAVDINFKEAKHDILLPMVTKLYAGTARRRIERTLESQLRDRMGFVNDKINQILNVAEVQVQKGYEKVVDSAMNTIQPVLLSK